MDKFEIITTAIRESWGADTSQDSLWSPANPALGQCAVSSMVMQDFFGGELLRGVTNKGTSHYWNRINNVWVDVTRDQFAADEYIVEWLVRPDGYLYKFDDTVERYHRLLRRVEERLDKVSWRLYTMP